MDMIDQIIRLALFEDSGLGDVTTESILPEPRTGSGIIVAKQDFVLAGMDVARTVFSIVDPDIRCDLAFKDGQTIKSGDVILEAKGDMLGLLKGERVALNFLQRLSGHRRNRRNTNMITMWRRFTAF